MSFRESTVAADRGPFGDLTHKITLRKDPRLAEQSTVVQSRYSRGNDPHGVRGRICERDMARVRVGHGIGGQNYCVIGGCLLSFSLYRRGFQHMLKVRPSSPLNLCGFISRSKLP